MMKVEYLGEADNGIIDTKKSWKIIETEWKGMGVIYKEDETKKKEILARTNKGTYFRLKRYSNQKVRPEHITLLSDRAAGVLYIRYGGKKEAFDKYFDYPYEELVL